MALLSAASSGFDAFALPVSHYAASSALADGKWVKVKVTTPGMQFVSNAELRTMGFEDPAAVNVYGFGGRMIPEILSESLPDDLPLLPCVRTTAGILFFGVDHIDWNGATGDNFFTHTMQPYAEESFYFLSDIPATAQQMAKTDLSGASSLPMLDTFIERIVHEQDIFAPDVTGRNLLGEDLRSPTQLNFPLPANANGTASVRLCVASNVSGANGSVRVASSNAKLSQNTFTVNALNNTEQFMRTNTFSLIASGVGNSLNLNLSFSSSGVINMIRLDYAELEYERDLVVNQGGQLYFYFNETSTMGATLKGVSADTRIWDVTVPWQPKEVKFDFASGAATFRVDAGLREFVAFDPSKVILKPEAAGPVANQDIHAMESPDMLIITPAEYISAAQKVASLHEKHDGLTVHILTPEQIYNEFSSGTADVSAFRKLLKMWYDRDLADGKQKIRYCLIFSRPTYDNKMATATVKNAGYPRVPIWQSPVGFTENSSYSTDDYIGMLDDQDAVLNMGTAKIHVAVGRFPVRNLEEANDAAEKLINYVTNPEQGSWRNNVMLVADDQDSGAHLDQTERTYNSLVNSAKGAHYQYERLYLDNFEYKLTSTGYEYPDAKKRLLSKFDEGQALITYIGHANTVAWSHEKLLTWGDITNFTNTRLPVLYAATCEFARWDADEYSGAEVMWSFPKTGVIAMICPSRAVYISMNGNISSQFGLNALKRNPDGSPTTLGDAYINAKNGVQGTDDNKLRYCLLGDPAMKMPVFSYDVEVTSIYDADVTDDDAELPTIEARSNPVVKGVVKDFNGEKAADFNGHVYLKLYDAEKVVETLGNGENGVVSIYNDRKSKLYEGVAKVENGEWETVIYMPTEIENNFTTGRMTFYALADDGREANGATEKFYVYGFDENADEDLDGPDILKFFINHESFKDGDVTYKTPVVYATFSDDSGINLSESGIGHTVSLTLDNSTVFSDVMSSYSPDIEDSRKGSIIYQLPEIKAGKHSLTIAVWDCANNSSYKTINFNVASVKDPDIYDLSAVINADRGSVDFIISSDRPLAALGCLVEIFDINGVRVWHNKTDERTDSNSSLKMSWNYTDRAGSRVDKGIYICRATVTTPEGKSARKSKKIVVSQ